MKKFIAILLTCSLGFAAGASAKQDDKKPGPKNKPVQQHPQQHLQLQKSKVNAVRTPTPHLNTTRIQKNNFTKHNPQSKITAPSSRSNDLSTNTKLLKKQPTVQTNELPAIQKNKNKQNTTIVNNQNNAANLQRIRAKFKNFHAKPNPKIASVQFNQNYQIQNSQNWSGPQYRVFQSYRPQWHDRSWWRSRYSSHLLLIGGGWYFWDAGYWYPAWGYDESASYYPYDGPIYVGNNARPFDQVVADCQATLQEQGYYKGEVDGLMGPLTRQALADFQRDHGLITTAALDQPTLDSLGLG